MSTLSLTREWDKTFCKSELVNHSKVTFHNRYGIELAADLYVPKDAQDRLQAIAVSGTYLRAGGVADPLPEDAPWFVKDYHS